MSILWKIDWVELIKVLFSIFDQNFVAGREHVVSFVGKNIGQIRLSVRTLGIVFSGY